MVILLASFKYGKRQLVMANKPGDCSQSETTKYFEWIILRPIRRYMTKYISRYSNIYLYSLKITQCSNAGKS